MCPILITFQYSRHCLVKLTNNGVHVNQASGSPAAVSRRADRQTDSQDDILTFAFRKARNNEKEGSQHTARKI
jgi:hypothetical protein